MSELQSQPRMDFTSMSLRKKMSLNTDIKISLAVQMDYFEFMSLATL